MSKQKDLTPEERKAKASKGGKARAAKLDPERKSEIAAMGGKAKHGDLAERATHYGILELGDKTLECAVLKGGTRILSQKSFFSALGRMSGGFLSKQSESLDNSTPGATSMVVLPPFLVAANLTPFISESLIAKLAPLKFVTRTGHTGLGYDAALLPKVCEVYLKAREAGVLTVRQATTAMGCEILVRVLAQTGLVALIDEATGYQYDRARDALQKLLKTYVVDAMLTWVPRFSHEFLKNAYRFCGWEYKEGVPIKPHMLGSIINRIVYEKLPAEVVEEIRTRNPLQENKKRKFMNHQFLTEDTGLPQLDRVLLIATAMMRAFEKREDFFVAYDKAIPTPPKLIDVIHGLSGEGEGKTV